MMDIPRRTYLFDIISEIYRTAEEIESESDSYSDAFNDAQYIEEQANELDTELTKLFNELYSFLRDIKEGGFNPSLFQRIFTTEIFTKYYKRNLKKHQKNQRDGR